jgi:hypothetical protein
MQMYSVENPYAVSAITYRIPAGMKLDSPAWLLHGSIRRTNSNNQNAPSDLLIIARPAVVSAKCCIRGAVRRAPGAPFRIFQVRFVDGGYAAALCLYWRI